jgi:hypothetical protein
MTSEIEGEKNLLELLDMGLQCLVIPKPAGKS